MGLCLIELLLSVSVVAMFFGGVVWLSDLLRARTADQQTRSTLLTLRSALDTYHRRHDAWPPGPTPAAIDALLAEPVTAAMVRSLPLTRQASGSQIRDGYGYPLRYHTQAPSRTRQADFASPGPDGRFGDPLSAQHRARLAAADDTASGDLKTALPEGPPAVSP